MIGVLIFPDFQLLDAAEADLGIRDRDACCGPAAVDQGDGGETGSGAQLIGRSELLARGIQPSRAITTLIVAGGWGVRTASTCPKTLALVRSMAKRGVRVASVCSGAYILAAAGILDGRRAATHWQRTRHFLGCLSPGETGGGPDLRPGRQHLEFGRHHRRHRSGAGDGGRGFRRRGCAEDRAAARALQPPQRRPVAILVVAGIESADRSLRAAARLGARASRRTADGGGYGRERAGHEVRGTSPAPSSRRPVPRRRRRWSACASKWRGSACSPPARRSSGSQRLPAFAIPNRCAAPSSAPSVSRRNHAARRAGGAGVGAERFTDRERRRRLT